MPGDPSGEWGHPPCSKSRDCRVLFWGQAAVGLAAVDGGGRTVTAREQKRLQDPPVGRSAVAIPCIRVITAIYYLGPRSPKYLLLRTRGRDVNACMGAQGFKPCSPASPGTGDEQGWGLAGAGAATGVHATSPRARQGRALTPQHPELPYFALA